MERAWGGRRLCAVTGARGGPSAQGRRDTSVDRGGPWLWHHTRTVIKELPASPLPPSSNPRGRTGSQTPEKWPEQARCPQARCPRAWHWPAPCCTSPSRLTVDSRTTRTPGLMRKLCLPLNLSPRAAGCGERRALRSSH